MKWSWNLLKNKNKTCEFHNLFELQQNPANQNNELKIQTALFPRRLQHKRVIKDVDSVIRPFDESARSPLLVQTNRQCWKSLVSRTSNKLQLILKCCPFHIQSRIKRRFGRPLKHVQLLLLLVIPMINNRFARITGNVCQEKSAHVYGETSSHDSLENRSQHWPSQHLAWVANKIDFPFTFICDNWKCKL
jgi:hypothetical protein